MKILKCENCGQEHDGSYGSGRFCSAHCRRIWSGKHSAKNGKHKCNFPKPKRAKYGTWKCKFCGLIFDVKRSLWKHLHEEHKQQLNGLHGKGQIAWNKGLSKDTNKTVNQISQKLKIQYKSGALLPAFKGKKHSSKSREKMSLSALNSDHQRVCKETLPYTCVDGTIVNLDSSYERKVAKILDENSIKWIRPKPLKWVSCDGKIHNYFPDFYLVDFDLYLDPKNEYCFKVQAEKIKYIFEHYSNVIFLHEQNLTDEFIMGLCHKGREAVF